MMVGRTDMSVNFGDYCLCCLLKRIMKLWAMLLSCTTGAERATFKICFLDLKSVFL